MTRKEYVEQVVSALRHANKAEREAIRAEIDAHIEDHICALLDLDYPADLAEERTMALMGDPEEVGRELDQHYTNHFWTNLEALAKLLLIPIFFQAFLGLGMLFHAHDSLIARMDPEVSDRDLAQEFESGWTEFAESPDLRLTIGNDVLRVVQVAVGERDVWNEMVLTAGVYMTSYDRVPFGIVSDEIQRGLTLTNQQGESMRERWFRGGNHLGSMGAQDIRLYVPVEPGDTHVTLTYDQYGEHKVLEIPLPEVME